MKRIKYALFVLVIGLFSCQDEFESEAHKLETLDLSPETLEFFEFYENTDQLVFKKVPIPKITHEVEKEKSSDFHNKRIENVSPEYWIFNKMGILILDIILERLAFVDQELKVSQSIGLLNTEMITVMYLSLSWPIIVFQKAQRNHGTKCMNSLESDIVLLVGQLT